MIHVIFVLGCILGLTVAAELPATPTTQWDGRIVGGTVVTGYEFSYMASLRTLENTHFCGGSILNNRWILSAAHCTVGRTAAAMMVIVGTINRITGGIRHNVMIIRNHPNYNSNTIESDVSLVQTQFAIIWDFNIRSIPIGTGFISGGINGQIAGWGQTAHPGSAANNLMWLNQQTLTNDDCRSRHTPNNAAIIFDSTLCVGGVNGQGFCMGDPGGGFIIAGAVHGIASWVIPCGRGYPDIYARVASFSSWITQNIQ